MNVGNITKLLNIQIILGLFMLVLWFRYGVQKAKKMQG